VKKLFPRNIFFISFLILKIIIFVVGHNAAYAQEDAYEVLPWRVGQYVVYEVISIEGEGVGNRYKISLVDEEKIDGVQYFWMEIEVYESVVEYGHNEIAKKLQKNISLKMLVPPKNKLSFIADPARFISWGIFPEESIRLAVQFSDGQWHWINPEDFFGHQDIILDTPYSLTPHAKGKINFDKMKIEKNPEKIIAPAGEFLCHHFFVDTSLTEQYYDEGLDLWRSSVIPILGLVKMEFSKTQYWQKLAYRKKFKPRNNLLDTIKSLYERRVPGRESPDTYTLLLLDYGPK